MENAGDQSDLPVGRAELKVEIASGRLAPAWQATAVKEPSQRAGITLDSDETAGNRCVRGDLPGEQTQVRSHIGVQDSVSLLWGALLHMEFAIFNVNLKDLVVNV